MVMTDNVADMLTRIRNGQKSKLLEVSVPYSNLKCSILDVLKEEGFILGYKVSSLRDGIKNIIVELKYSDIGMPAIKQIQRVSKPGRRLYSSIDDIKDYYSGMGLYVLSTSKGVISDRKANEFRVGGELICRVF